VGHHHRATGGLAILGRLRVPGQFADGRAFVGGYFYCAFALRVQFDQVMAVTAAGAQFGPPGYETNLLYLACLAALVLGGSDHWP
jgi:hypothetical protein